MKTDEMRISQGVSDVEKVLDKIEFIALYTGMTRREASNMRLLSEELLMATKNILDVSDGSLWMETSDTSFSLHLSVTKPHDRAKRDELIALSKSGKATLPKGLFSKLTVSLENYLLLDEGVNAAVIFTDYSIYTGDACGMGAMYAYQYLPKTNDSRKDKEEKPSDELAGIEKSIIDSIVDDIIVTLKNNSIEIIAVKELTK